MRSVSHVTPLLPHGTTPHCNGLLPTCAAPVQTIRIQRTRWTRVHVPGPRRGGCWRVSVMIGAGGQCCDMQCVMRLVVGGWRWLVVIVGELVVCRHLLRLLHPMWSTGPCAHAWHAQDVRRRRIA